MLNQLGAQAVVELCEKRNPWLISMKYHDVLGKMPLRKRNQLLL
jgi:hypothetical protein